MQLVEKYKDRAYNLALNYIRDPHYAEDIAQEVFLKVYTSLASYRLGTNFKAWLYRIVHNFSMDTLRKRRRETVLKESINKREENNPYSKVDTNLALEEAIKRLPPEYRAVITLRYQEDLSYEEIAEAMDIPIGTVKTWLFRAKEALRDGLSRT